MFELTARQKKELFTLEEGLYRSKKQLHELQQEEIEQKREFLRTKLFLVSSRIDILNEIFNTIKSSIRVTESEVLFARSEHNKMQQVSNAKRQEEYDPYREKIEQEIAKKRLELQEFSKRYNIIIGEEVNSWNKAPSATVESWLGYVEVGRINDEILLLERKRDLLDIDIIKEDEKLRLDEILINVQDSFLKKDTGRFSSEEKISKEIVSYEAQKTKVKANSATITSKKNNALAYLEVQKRAAENIQQRLKEIEEQRRIVFKGHIQEFVRVNNVLQDSWQLVNNQIDVITKIIDSCNDILLKLNKSFEVIEFIAAELESIRIIWQRPEHAISWEGARRMLPDIERFITDIQVRVSTLYGELISRTVRDMARHPLAVLLFFIQLIALVGILFLLYKLLVLVRDLLAEYTSSMQSAFKTIGLLLLTLLNFIIDYFIPIALWLSVFSFLKLYIVSDTISYILFYLASIPYLLILLRCFISFFVRANEWYGYQFIGKNFQGRFVSLFSVLMYATIAILFFRQAFLLGGYTKSELPNILLALNFIVLQISVIFLIEKEQILHLIPQTHDIWLWIREQVDDYYYFMLLFMVAIVVMTHIIYTVLLVMFFVWLHTLLKRSSATLFFQTEQDAVKERFVGAKTWYGIFIIGFLLSLVFFGAIVVAKIWNWPPALSGIANITDIITWLKTPLLLANTDSPISFYTFLYILFFVFMGVVVSFFIKQFVLARIFDVLLVDAGIQYTVTSIMRYLVMLIAIVFGFNAVGLGQQMNYIITAVVFGIAWVVKDPVSDFFAYFIILVQRPVKIGDFIKIDSEVTGVVRRITPRSIVLRRKNSTMIVVPNSYFMTRPIINWNYSRGFIAFEDIIIKIDYEENPLQVMNLFYRILDENQYVLKNPKPIIRLDHFSDYGYEFMIRGFLSSNYTLEKWNIASDIRLQIVQTFAREGIKLALPIRVSVQKSVPRYQEGASVQLRDDFNMED